MDQVFICKNPPEKLYQNQDEDDVTDFVMENGAVYTGNVKLSQI